MTPLEIILVIVLWIIYGLYAVSRTDIKNWEYFDAELFRAATVILSPLILVVRALHGIFKKYE